MRPSRPLLLALAVTAVALLPLSAAARSALAGAGGRWTAAERAALRSLSLSSLGAVPADPSNRFADDQRNQCDGAERYEWAGAENQIEKRRCERSEQSRLRG